MTDGDALYIVTAYVDGETMPRSYHVAAESQADAEELVAADERVEEVLDSLTEQFSGQFRVDIGGSPEEIADAIDALEHLAPQVDAEMDVRDVTPTVWPAGDDLKDGDAVRVAVDDWSDIELRIIGDDVSEDDDDVDGYPGVLSATPAAMQARDNSTVDVVAGDRVLVRAVKDTGDIPQLESGGGDA